VAEAKPPPPKEVVASPIMPSFCSIVCGCIQRNLTAKRRDEGVRPLIKHREFRPIDPRVVRVIDGPRYRQRATRETVLSTIKRTLGDAVVRAPGTVSLVIVLLCV